MPMKKGARATVSYTMQGGLDGSFDALMWFYPLVSAESNA